VRREMGEGRCGKEEVRREKGDVRCENNICQLETSSFSPNSNNKIFVEGCKTFKSII